LRAPIAVSNEKRRRKEGSPATLGLLIDFLEDDYQNAVLNGIIDAARERGASLICFTGGVIRANKRAGGERNAVYDLVGPESVDGLLVMAGTLSNTIGMIELSRYCERYRPLPICSIAVAIDSFPSVLIDNMSGMWAQIDHLIKVHGLRRIAFLRGPDANSEAERRFRVYRDVLAENVIPQNPSLVVQGNFQRASGAEAVRVLLDERHADIQAIVAANDGMALGAIEALHARGKRVPDDIAVVGFDDIEEARLSTPALTTVRQPLHEQGRRATQILLERIDGRAGPERIILRTELVTRRSCGCLPRPGIVRTDTGAPPSVIVDASGPEPFDVSIAAARDAILADMTKAARALIAGDLGWAARLLDAFTADLADSAGTSFLSTFDAILRDEILKGGDSSAWQEVLSMMRRRILPHLARYPERAARAEDLWHGIRIWISGAEARAQARQSLMSQRAARLLGEIGTALITAFDIDTLISTVTRELPRLGIASCYLSLYDGDRTPAETSRLLVAYDTSAEVQPRATEATFPSRKLAPDGMLPAGRRSDFVLEPLFFKEEQLGFVLFEMGPRHGAIYEILRDQLSAALKGALLVKQVADKDREQRRLLVDLEKRAFQLERAQEALKENQAKLGTARSAAKEAVRLASNAAERASNFTRTGGRPPPARESSPGEAPRVPFNAVPCTRDAIALLTNVIRQAGCRVMFEPPSEVVELSGAPARFAQIVTNLLMNAVDASLIKDGGVITVHLSRAGNTVELVISDSGGGIAPDALPKLFEPPPIVRGYGPPSDRPCIFRSPARRP